MNSSIATGLPETFQTLIGTFAKGVISFDVVFIQ
jgi:hypothetical protein